MIRSPFIDKDSREQFEMRTHKRILDILDANPKVGRRADAPQPAERRQHRDQAVSKGILARKVGMTQIFTPQGTRSR